VKLEYWQIIGLGAFALFLAFYTGLGKKSHVLSFNTSEPITIKSTKNIQNSPFAQFKQKKPQKVPILMYHYVEYNLDKNDYLRDSLNIPPHIFEHQIITLKDAGYTFVVPSEIYGKSYKPVQKPIILSFDDGYGDFYTDVYPILQKHNAKAVSYLVGNFIGRQNYMTEPQVKEIAKGNLVEFGSHTMNHLWLVGLDGTTVEHELVESKRFLTELTGRNIESFAYPFGVYDANVEQLVAKAGYSNAVSTNTGVSDANASSLSLKRLRPGYNVGADLVNVIEK